MSRYFNNKFFEENIANDDKKLLDFATAVITNYKTKKVPEKEIHGFAYDLFVDAEEALFRQQRRISLDYATTYVDPEEDIWRVCLEHKFIDKMITMLEDRLNIFDDMYAMILLVEGIACNDVPKVEKNRMKKVFCKHLHDENEYNRIAKAFADQTKFIEKMLSGKKKIDKDYFGAALNHYKGLSKTLELIKENNVNSDDACDQFNPS